MSREHGTNARYVIDRCRCDDCRVAARDYNRELRARIVPAYVSARPARVHVKRLRRAGLGLKAIAEASGVPHGSLSKLIYGDPQRNMKPSRRIRPSTADRILAVTPNDGLNRTLIDAAPTWKLINEMTDAGVPKAAIAAGLGFKSPGLQIQQATIRTSTARSVADLHARWLSGDWVPVRRRRGAQPTPIPPPERSLGPDDIGHLYDALINVIETRRSQEWRSSAACRGRPTWMWFPDSLDERTAAQAKKVCDACLVRAQCAEANKHEPDGIYAGVVVRSRAA